jgi:hypothetical protein
MKGEQAAASSTRKASKKVVTAGRSSVDLADSIYADYVSIGVLFASCIITMIVYFIVIGMRAN